MKQCKARTMMKRPRKSTGPARKHLPAFRSDAELVQFVETHDLAGYWDSFTEVENPIELDPGLARTIDRRSRRKLISIRL